MFKDTRVAVEVAQAKTAEPGAGKHYDERHAGSGERAKRKKRKEAFRKSLYRG